MSIYAIGDIQGCYDELLTILDKIQFDPVKDKIWFTGDLVNRGPQSLPTLRFVKSLGDSAVTVLGNHDLHLLAYSCQQRKVLKKDTLQAVLDAPDRDELLHWLRFRPLFHYTDDFCLVHAGLPPQWNFSTTKKMAHLAEKTLQRDDYIQFFKVMYGNQPNIWSDDLQGMEKLRFIINCFTRIRYCETNGRLDFNYNGPLGTQPKHLHPWFDLPERKMAARTIIFGHWSSLGYHEENNCYGIDTGCLWGGQLTVLKLGKKIKRISIACSGYRKIG